MRDLSINMFLWRYLLFGFIYITTNTVNGKKYIGQCRYGKRGWKTYLGSGKALKRAIKKYGKESFEREILEECSSREHLIERENFYLKKFNVRNNPDFYNIQARAYATKGFEGRKHNDERKQKLRDMLSGKPRPKHVIEKLIKSNRGRKRTFTDEHKRNMSKAHGRRKIVTFNGVTYNSLREAADRNGVSLHTIRKWITTGICSKPKITNSKEFELNGIMYDSVAEASRKTGIPVSTLYNRKNRHN